MPKTIAAKPKCPACGRQFVYWKVPLSIFICRLCGETWSKTEAVKP